MNFTTFFTWIVATAITAVWITGAFVAVLTGDNALVTIATPLMLVLAGYLFGIKIVKEKNGNGRSS